MNTSQKQAKDTLRSGPLQIGFRWHRDRFAHSISLFDSSRQLPLLASLEGNDEQKWPPSPVLQELHFEDHPTGMVALLVGSTKQSHYSLAIATTDIGFSFDAACRLLNPTTPSVDDMCLQSGYRAMLQPAIQNTLPTVIEVGKVLMTVDDRSCCPPLAEGVAEDIAWRLTIMPQIIDENSKTVSWRYKIGISEQHRG